MYKLQTSDIAENKPAILVIYKIIATPQNYLTHYVISKVSLKRQHH
jgi:hypothetical protein